MDPTVGWVPLSLLQAATKTETTAAAVSRAH
jgi:hypothetical protein